MKKPVRRDTTLSAGRDMLSRLLLMMQIVTLVGGILLCLYGYSRQLPDYVTGGIATLVAFVILIPVRRRWFSTDQRSAPPTASIPKPTAPAPQPAAPSAGARRPRILLINAALGGTDGNTAAALEHLAKQLQPHADLARVTLAARPPLEKTIELMAASDGFVLATGTHWDSWSSHLQAFLENLTPHEGTPLLLGKPAACVITEHSVGGKAVLSRLQGVLVTLGCAIPPMSGLVLSRSALTAAEERPEVAEDFWSLDDLATVAANLLAAARAPREAYTAWPVDREHLHDRWLD
ncbi:MAG: NAD(P)H-dependent oxidoreductase [Verrucomicrobiota bacterium]